MSDSVKLRSPLRVSQWARGGLPSSLGCVVLLLAATPAHAQQSAPAAQRSEEVPVAGAKVVRIDADLNTIAVQGRAGLKSVRVRSSVFAPSADAARDIGVRMTRAGDTIVVASYMPEIGSESVCAACRCRVDFSVEVPPTMGVVLRGGGEVHVDSVGPANIIAGSGPLRIRHVRGLLTIESGLNTASVSDVDGAVIARSSSGRLTLQDVNGSVILHRVGPGGVALSRVTGDAQIDTLGAAFVSVKDVGGNLVVRERGTGAIVHSRVRGTVTIPPASSDSIGRWR